MASLRVVNIVVTTDLEHELPLERITALLPNVEYNPETFPGLIMKIKEPKTSALLFTSGKVVCTGAKTIADAKAAINMIIGHLGKISIRISIIPTLKVQNMVGSGKLGFDLNLNEIMMRLNNVEYEPEQFPGLVYKMREPFHASFLLFTNGKIVCTGTKSEEEMETCLAQLLKELERAGQKAAA